MKSSDRGGCIKNSPRRVAWALLLLSFFLAQCSAGSKQISYRPETGQKFSKNGRYLSPEKPWRPGVHNDIPVVMNPSVKKWVNIFDGKLKPNFSRWVFRLGRYGPTIDRILQEENVPRDLIYLAMIESGFNLAARSRAAAVGPWQFIKSTGSLYGLNSGFFIDDRQDLVTATRAAARHLKDLYQSYGDWYLAFAAYNAGAGKVNRALRRGHSRDYWRLSAARGRLFRQETKDYVPKILAALHIVKNYKDFGYRDMSFGPPLEYEQVTVPDAMDIAAIARVTEVEPAVIQELNPSLVLGITPPEQHTAIYIPKGAKEEFEKNYKRLPEDQRVSSVTYRTGTRETLDSIANKYGIAVSELSRLNNIHGTRTRLKPGTSLILPANKTTLLALARGGKGDYSSGSSPSKVVYYRVRPGDSLSRIARRHGTTVGKLASWNRLRKNSQLKIGQKLKIYQTIKVSSSGHGSFVATYTPKKADGLSGVAHIILQENEVGSGEKFVLVTAETENDAETVPLPIVEAVEEGEETTAAVAVEMPAFIRGADGELTASNPETEKQRLAEQKKIAKTAAAAQSTPKALQNKAIVHHVRSGETLWSLSKKYGVPISDIIKWNGLKSSTVRPKQRLKIVST